MYTSVLNVDGTPYILENGGHLYYRDRGNCLLESNSIPAHYLLPFSDARMKLKMLCSMGQVLTSVFDQVCRSEHGRQRYKFESALDEHYG